MIFHYLIVSSSILTFQGMKQFLLVVFILLSGCSSPPSSPVDNGISSDLPQGHESDYTVWTFLEKYPSEKLVVETLGPPDSVWIDEKMEFKMLYYFLPELQDYNSIEINLNTGKTAGFEWD